MLHQAHGACRRIPLLAFAIVLLGAAACRDVQGGKGASGQKQAGKRGGEDDGHVDDRVAPPRPLPIEGQRVLRALEAKVATLERTLAEGDRARSPHTGLINAHEHLYRLKDLERYLPAARAAGIASTVLVSSPKFTLQGKGDKGEPGMSDNFAEVLRAAAAYPGEVVPFCTLDPEDDDKLARLKKHVEQGCKGVKLYSGHSNFYDGPLDAPDLLPVYAWLEETQLPVLWHINLTKFFPDFERVLSKTPNLNVMVPHYGVAFWRPKGETLDKIKGLLRKHPNLFFDTSLGTREILINGMAVMEPARDVFVALFTEFPNQIVWGTDSVITGNPEKTTAWFSKVIWATRDQLEKDVFQTELAAAYSKYHQKGRDGDGRYQGLALPPEIVQKVYVDNAVRWLRYDPRAKATTTSP